MSLDGEPAAGAPHPEVSGWFRDNRSPHSETKKNVSITESLFFVKNQIFRNQSYSGFYLLFSFQVGGKKLCNPSTITKKDAQLLGIIFGPHEFCACPAILTESIMSSMSPLVSRWTGGPRWGLLCAKVGRNEARGPPSRWCKGRVLPRRMTGDKLMVKAEDETTLLRRGYVKAKDLQQKKPLWNNIVILQEWNSEQLHVSMWDGAEPARSINPFSLVRLQCCLKEVLLLENPTLRHFVRLVRERLVSEHMRCEQQNWKTLSFSHSGLWVDFLCIFYICPIIPRISGKAFQLCFNSNRHRHSRDKEPKMRVVYNHCVRNISPFWKGVNWTSRGKGDSKGQTHTARYLRSRGWSGCFRRGTHRMKTVQHRIECGDVPARLLGMNEDWEEEISK